MLGTPRLAIALGACLVAVAAQARAEAPDVARCAVRVVLALPQEGGVAPELAPLNARLTRPPFLHWKTFRQLSQEEHTLKPGESADYKLPSGRDGKLVYAEHATLAGGRHVVRGSFRVEGGKSSARTMFALDEGGSLLIAGHRYDDGILIYALSCTAH